MLCVSSVVYFTNLRHKMEEKRFGVKPHLIQELRRFQSNLKRKREKMPFEESATTSVNDSPVTVRRVIIVTEGRFSMRLSMMPSILIPALRPPRQILEELGGTAVRMQLEPGFDVTIIFDEMDHKTRFITSMGDLNASSSSSEEENK